MSDRARLYYFIREIYNYDDIDDTRATVNALSVRDERILESFPFLQFRRRSYRNARVSPLSRRKSTDKRKPGGVRKDEGKERKKTTLTPATYEDALRKREAHHSPATVLISTESRGIIERERVRVNGDTIGCRCKMHVARIQEARGVMGGEEERAVRGRREGR